MITKIQYIVVFCMSVVIFRSCFSDKLKRFQSNARVSDKSETDSVRSLLQCAALFENSLNSLSMNYNKDDKICELSDNYPEDSTIVDAGWKVYAKIADGAWAKWMNWGSCSVTCEGGSRTRTRSCNNPPPSNGGKKCPGQSTETGICNERDCYMASDYFISTDSVTWMSAETACTSMSARLVILESQEEIDFLEDMVTKFEHWIGMTCKAGTDCHWVDGRSVEDGFKAWAPNEPNDGDCVWIGYGGSKWDDANCDDIAPYICEFL